MNKIKSYKSLRSLTPKAGLFAVLFYFYLFASLAPTQIQTAQATTVDWYMCSNKVTTGEWNFGRVYGLCNVTDHMTPDLVSTEYAPTIFNDLSTRTSERQRYMTEMYPILRDVGTYFLKKRKPNVSSEELQGFLQALYTVAQKETYWSHYRSTGDGVIRYTRGDVGHGHGILQVDDRYHLVNINQGMGVDLVNNILAGLTIFYPNWVNSATASCVPSATDYQSRARAAWAAFNGGPPDICRWTNTDGGTANSDNVFNLEYNNRTWSKYLKSTNTTPSIDIQCLVNGRTPCGLPSTTPVTQTLSEGHLYKTPSGSYCLYQDATLQCVNDYRDVACIEESIGASLGSGEAITNASVLSSYKQKTFDRNVLCAANTQGLISLGKTLTVLKSIELRVTAGTGAILTTLPSGSSYTVVGFEVHNWQTQDRYYRVKVGALDGYFYGGASSDYATWARVAVVPPSPTPAPAPGATPEPKPAPAPSPNPSAPVPGLARAGDLVKIINVNGINLRPTIGSTTQLATVATSTVLEVLSVKLVGNDVNVYYLVNYMGAQGYIFVGAIDPVNTLANWAQVIPKSQYGSGPLRTAMLTAGTDYRNLRSCAGALCFPTGNIVTGDQPPKAPDLLIIESVSGSFSKVLNTQTGAEGWLYTNDIVEAK